MVPRQEADEVVDGEEDMNVCGVMMDGVVRALVVTTSVLVLYCA